MAELILRPATEADFPAIKRLIHRVRINPTGLDWRRFVVMVDETDKVRACGQLKPHENNRIWELASIAVDPSRRGQGAARRIIEHLISDATRPLYLICQTGMGPFYEKWGFRSIEQDEMPEYFRRLARMAALMPAFMSGGQGLLVMQLD